MAVWAPNNGEPIGPAERIGRRLFGRPRLAGAKQGVIQTGFELYHFEEKRDQGEVSLDRLGKTGADRRIKVLLTPISQAAGMKYGEPREFQGWATVVARQIQGPAKGPNIELLASPVVEDLSKGIARNDYHAHACRPEGYGFYEMALHLKMIFDSENVREAPSGSPGEPAETLSAAPKTAPSALGKAWEAVRKLLSRVRT